MRGKIEANYQKVEQKDKEMEMGWGREFEGQFEVSRLNGISRKNNERGQKILRRITHEHFLDLVDMTL